MWARPTRVCRPGQRNQAKREERRRALAEAWQERCRQFGARMRMVDANQIAPGRPNHTGPMSRGELYLWHLRNGTLELFFAMFPG